MFDLKPLSLEAIDAALEKAVRYRLLNEPLEAESICRDILATDLGHAGAIEVLLLALTDMFAERLGSANEARELANSMSREYDRAYYNGIVSERRGKSVLRKQSPGSGPAVYDWLRDAMGFFEKAQELSPKGNDDAILRWNACARLIMRHSSIRPDTEERVESMLE